jgi:hypothetical protein
MPPWVSLPIGSAPSTLVAIGHRKPAIGSMRSPNNRNAHTVFTQRLQMMSPTTKHVRNPFIRVCARARSVFQ